MFKPHALSLMLQAAFAGATLLPCMAQAATLSVPAGQTVQITSTTALTQLTLGEGAQVTAPSGYSVTLTVDGVGKAQKAKTYSGDVVLTVTENINVDYVGSAETLHHIFRSGIYVNDGAYVPAKSVAAIVQGGSVGDALAQGVSIKSQEETFNGIVVDGASTYAIKSPYLRLIGNGGDDFAGFGAAIKSAGTANVTVDGAKIYTKGAVRTAVFAGGSSTMTVKNSSIEAYGGTLPADYVWNVDTGKMMEVPWMLGITGNNRATNLVGSATANYINSHIKSQAWGALSTDDTTKVRLNVSKSVIDVLESGYGSYAIGDAVNTFSASTFNVPDMALIMANGAASAEFNKGTVVNSGRFGVMMHGNSGGTLKVVDSTFNTKAAIVQAKSSSPIITFQNATLNSENGILIQAVVNDDPYQVALGVPASGSNVTATLLHTHATGDIINGNTATAGVSVALKHSSLTGAITTAFTTHATGPNGEAVTFDHPELYYLVGEFRHTYATTGQAVTVTLDGSSSWTVSQTSYLTSLKLAQGAQLKAPDGKALVMTVNGTVTPITAGKTFAGTVVLAVQ